MKTHTQFILVIFLILALGLFAAAALGQDLHSLAVLDASSPALAAPTATDCAVQTQIPQTECETLVAFYDSTDGDNWVDNTDWKITDTPCSWYGLSCFPGGHVTGIVMRDNQLSGPLPDLSALTSLDSVDLGGNQLSSVPDLSALTNLKSLFLFDNQLTSIPDLSALTNLRELRLSNNQLTSIPDLSALINLDVLYLGDNQLTSIPDLSALTSLGVLGLSSNHLSFIPDLSALTNLSALYLDGNQLSLIPDLSSLTNLQDLRLHNNQLSMIPGLSVLSNLVLLYAFDNQLSGSFPDLSALTSLIVVNLGGNQLSGPLPDLSTLPDLEETFVHNNQLSGSIPASVCSAIGVDFGFNMFTGADDPCVTIIDSDWANTQTVPPSNVQAQTSLFAQINLTWDAIPYTDDGGYYEAMCSTTQGGPYTSFGKTKDKFAAELNLKGLAPDTTYYCVVNTFTPHHGDQQNDLTSINSAEVSAKTSELWQLFMPRQGRAK